MGDSSLGYLYDCSYRDLTDKGTYHSYIELYDVIFEPYREKEITLLEIGVKEGGSLLLWADYFLVANIVGLDVNLAVVMDEVREKARIRLVQGNATSQESIDQAVDNVDIVIDDGSHLVHDQITAFKMLEAKLNPGGLYIMEDIYPFENASRIQHDIPGSEIVDRRLLKGQLDDVMLIFRKP